MSARRQRDFEEEQEDVAWENTKSVSGDVACGCKALRELVSNVDTVTQDYAAWGFAFAPHAVHGF